MDVLNLIARHGPLLLGLLCFVEAIGLPLPAAIALLGAGALCDQDQLPLVATFAAGLGGLLLGDLLLYLVGRYSGWFLLGLLCRLSANPESCVHRSAQTFYQKGRTALLFTKFIPGINTMAAPLAGSLRMRPEQFFAFDLAGALIYAGAYFGLGYVFSDLLGVIVTGIAGASELVKSALIVGGLAYVGYRIYLVRKLRSDFLDIPRVSASDAAVHLERGPADIAVFDVRSHGYYENAAYRIHGSVRLEPNRLFEALRDLPEAKKVYLYCT